MIRSDQVCTEEMAVALKADRPEAIFSASIACDKSSPTHPEQSINGELARSPSDLTPLR